VTGDLAYASCVWIGPPCVRSEINASTSGHRVFRISLGVTYARERAAAHSLMLTIAVSDSVKLPVWIGRLLSTPLDASPGGGTDRPAPS
jgi:hypothetical protein